MRLDEQVAAVERALEALRQAADRAAQLLGLGAAHGAAPLRVQPRGIQARAFLRAAGGASRRRCSVGRTHRVVISSSMAN